MKVKTRKVFTHTINIHTHSACALETTFSEKSIESAKGQRRMKKEISFLKTFVDVQ